MQAKELTKRQSVILNFIQSTIAKKGFPPTIFEIMKEFRFGSPTSVNDHLNAIEKKGFIVRQPFTSRGIKIVESKISTMQTHNATVPLPIVGKVAAEEPILADENIEGYLNVDQSIVQQQKNTFVLEVKGDSMINAGIFNGDYVIVNKQQTVNQGEIAAVLIDNEATVKRVYINANEIRLQPENDLFKPSIIRNQSKDVSIMGKVKAVIRRKVT